MTTERSFDEESRRELETLQRHLDEQMGGDAPDVFDLANAYIDRKNAAVGEPIWLFGKRYIWVMNDKNRLCLEKW